jgi:hypothetical protein
MTTTVQAEPLELRALERRDSETETADLRLDVDGDGDVEMELAWGPSLRQQRAYLLGKDDLYTLHEWLTRVLGLDE